MVVVVVAPELAAADYTQRCEGTVGVQLRFINSCFKNHNSNNKNDESNSIDDDDDDDDDDNITSSST